MVTCPPRHAPTVPAHTVTVRDERARRCAPLRWRPTSEQARRPRPHRMRRAYTDAAGGAGTMVRSKRAHGHAARTGYRAPDLHAETSEIEVLGRQTGLGVGDPQLCGALVGGRQQPPDPARDGVLRQDRRGELAQLLERRLLVREPQLAGLAEVLRKVGTEDLESPLDARSRGDRGACRAAKVR